MDTAALLVSTLEKICADHCTKEALDAAEGGEFPYALWRVLVENGLHDLALPDTGLEAADVYAVLRAAGRHALPLPLAEMVFGKRWLAASGIDSADKVVGVGLAAGKDVVHIPWGRQAELVIAVAPREFGAELNAQQFTAAQLCDADGKQHGDNLAGEARDALLAVTSHQALAVAASGVNPYDELALARTVQMAGALEAVLAMSLTYVNEREQFGRSIAKFQAIQHNLAILAAEVAAAIRAADSAVAALGSDRFVADLAAAKARVGEAAGVVAEIAHQVHGAMGFTYEHRLHHFTRRLWAWRDEYGSEAHWQQLLGRALVAQGADALWPFMATRG